MKHLVETTLLAGICLDPTAGPAHEAPLPRAWDYADAMKAVARRGARRPGVVLHVGDSITHANPYGQWARAGGLGTRPPIPFSSLACGSIEG
jgi:hypothetical protein